jgi:hypothetical protein
VILECPECPERIEVSEEDPDASLSDLWAHLGTHTVNQVRRQALFIKTQVSAS